MSNTLKFGNGTWATKEGSTLAYNDENNNFKPLPFNFTRDSGATRVNKEGLIEVVSNNEPRIDFKDSKGALKLEPLRSNLFTYSEDFTQGWSKSNVSISKNTQISPDGTQNADTFSVTSGFGYYYQAPSLSSGSTVTQSIFVKNIDADRIILLARKLTTSGSASFYFTNSEITSVDLTSGISADFEDYGNGWYRIYLTCQTDEDNEWFRFQLPESGNSCYIWGAQLEQGSYATSYIPTQGSIGTRVAESCNNGANEQVINSTEGVLYVETKGFIDVPPTSKYIQLSKNGEASFNNSLVLQHRNNGYLRIYANGTATANIHFNENIDFSENHKIAVLYKLNGYKLFIDGVEKNLFGTPLQTVFSGLDDFSFDNRGDNGWNGKIKEVKLYNEILTDQELINLTTI